MPSIVPNAERHAWEACELDDWEPGGASGRAHGYACGRGGCDRWPTRVWTGVVVASALDGRPYRGRTARTRRPTLLARRAVQRRRPADVADRWDGVRTRAVGRQGRGGGHVRRAASARGRLGFAGRRERARDPRRRDGQPRQPPAQSLVGRRNACRSMRPSRRPTATPSTSAATSRTSVVCPRVVSPRSMLARAPSRASGPPASPRSCTPSP